MDTSKFKGYEDKYLIGGTYWPPQYSIMDGETEPIKVVSTRGQTVDGEYHPEPRVASIVASHIKPEWVVNVKETGQIIPVDYTDLKNSRPPPSSRPSSSTTAAGTTPSATSWSPPTPPTRSRQSIPRPASWPRWSTPRRSRTRVAAPTSSTRSSARSGPPATGDDVVSLISTASDDPKYAKYKEHNWKVVQELKMPGAGNLFVKTHPKSKNLWADAPMNPERKSPNPSTSTTADLSKAPKRLDVAKDSGLPESKAIRRATHPEYNEAGDEVWISLWGGKTDQSAIVIYDDKTLKLKKVITDPAIVTPTGKFNVFNTMHDVY